MGDETAALQDYTRWSSSPYSLSKALCHLSLCPASSFPSVPSLLPGTACYFVHPCSKHAYLIHFALLWAVSFCADSLCCFFVVVPKDERKKCQNWRKNTRQWIFIDNTLTLNIFPLFCPLLLLTCLSSSLFSLFTQPNILTVALFLEFLSLTAVISRLLALITSCMSNPITRIIVR